MFLVSFAQFVYTWQTGRQTTKHPGEVRKQRKSDLNGQVKIWKVHALSSVCHINKSWQKFKNHLLGALYSGQLLAHLSNIQVVGTLLKASQKNRQQCLVAQNELPGAILQDPLFDRTHIDLHWQHHILPVRVLLQYLGDTKQIFFFIRKQLKSLRLESVACLRKI
jgi:hypothetical protein